MTETRPDTDQQRAARERYRKVIEIHQGAFVREGALVALPLGFPGATTPIPPDESRITALTPAPDGNIYGATSGRACHIFVYMPHSNVGVTFDLQRIADCDHAPAVCCWADGIVALLNGPDGGRAILRPYQRPPLPDAIQEWGFLLAPGDDLGPIADGRRVQHAVSADDQTILIAAEDRLLRLRPADRSVETLAELPGRGRLVARPDGSVLGPDADNTLWRYDFTKGLTRKAVPLPDGGQWSAPQLYAAAGPDSRATWWVDAAGEIFRLSEDDQWTEAGRAPLQPPGPIVALHDGRLLGVCGGDMVTLFVREPDGRVRSLGKLVSTIQRRRYGYQIADMLRDVNGHVILGEDDDFGHLWRYFPALRPQL